MAQTARYVEGTQPGRSHGGRFHSTGAGSTLAEEPLPVAPGASRRVSPSGSSHPVSGSATVLSDPVPAASSHPATATAMGPRRPPSRCLPLPAASPLAPAGKGRCADPAPAADPLPSLPPTSLTWSSWARACRGEVHAACVRSGETTLSRDVLKARLCGPQPLSSFFPRAEGLAPPHFLPPSPRDLLGVSSSPFTRAPHSKSQGHCTEVTVPGTWWRRSCRGRDCRLTCEPERNGRLLTPSPVQNF